MINVWRLTKIQLLSSFGLNRALHTRDVKERRKLFLLSAAILMGMIMLTVISFGYSYGLAMSLEQLGSVDLLLAVMMAATSVIGLFTTIYKASGVLFGFNDYDLVMSLPIKTSHIVASRVLQLYILNLFFTVMVMLPAAVVYAMKVNPGVLFYPLFLITLCCIPLIPIIAATIIGSLISWIASRFKASRMISLFLTMVVVVGAIIGSFHWNRIEQVDADMIEQLADMIFKLYPLAALYVDAVCSFRIVPFLLFAAGSVVAFMLFSVGLGAKFRAIHTGLTTSQGRSKFMMRPMEVSSPFLALYKKELRRYISSSLYVLNTSIGMIVLLVMSIALLFIRPDEFSQWIEIPTMADVLIRLAPLAVSMFVVLSGTTACSISLEGNHLWILRSSPLPTPIILLSKVAVNLTLTIPVLVISWALLLFSLPLSWKDSIWLLVIPVLYAIFTALVGVIVNLKWPKFDWTSEVTVIKQSASVIVSMLIGLTVLVVPAVLSLVLIELDGNIVLSGIGLIMAVGCGLLYRYMHIKGDRLFQKL